MFRTGPRSQSEAKANNSNVDSPTSEATCRGKLVIIRLKLVSLNHLLKLISALWTGKSKKCKVSLEFDETLTVWQVGKL